MTYEEKLLLAKLKVLEDKEKEAKMKEDRMEIQQIADTCVFHYTNTGTLIGMLKDVSEDNTSMTFWASHISYMNDPQEREYGIKKMWEVLKDVEDELLIPSKKRITELDREELDKFIFVRNTDKNSLTNMYSVSFSKSFDSLPMWEMYGQNGNGICLGFDLKKLQVFLESQKMEPLHEIKYGIGENIDNPQTVREEMKSWKEYVRYVYEKIVHSIEEKHIFNDLDTAINNYIALLNFIPGNTKHPAYKYEDEYRLYCREINRKVFFRDRNGSLLPYVEVELPVSALKIITIGPTADKNRQVMSVAKLMKEKDIDINQITFCSSDIPYRP